MNLPGACWQVNTVPPKVFLKLFEGSGQLGISMSAGIRADAKRAKEPSDKNPGIAWSHNFLNQKPWHPSNFRNQARVFEAEQKSAQAAKSNAIAKVLFCSSYSDLT